MTGKCPLNLHLIDKQYFPKFLFLFMMHFRNWEGSFCRNSSLSLSFSLYPLISSIMVELLSWEFSITTSVASIMSVIQRLAVFIIISLLSSSFSFFFFFFFFFFIIAFTNKRTTVFYLETIFLLAPVQAPSRSEPVWASTPADEVCKVLRICFYKEPWL